MRLAVLAHDQLPEEEHACLSGARVAAEDDRRVAVDDPVDLDLLEQVDGREVDDLGPAGRGHQVDDRLPLGRLLVVFGLLRRDARVHDRLVELGRVGFALPVRHAARVGAALGQLQQRRARIGPQPEGPRARLVERGHERRRAVVRCAALVPHMERCVHACACERARRARRSRARQRGACRRRRSRVQVRARAPCERSTAHAVTQAPCSARPFWPVRFVSSPPCLRQ